MTCPECGKWAPPDPETGYDADDYCSAQCEENSIERAYQRQLEDYYGGDEPQTDRERYERDWQEKRRLS